MDIAPRTIDMAALLRQVGFAAAMLRRRVIDRARKSCAPDPKKRKSGKKP
jgi:hypothetical protein